MYIRRVGERVRKKRFDCRGLDLSNICIRSCSSSSSSTRAEPYGNLQSSSMRTAKLTKIKVVFQSEPPDGHVSTFWDAKFPLSQVLP